MLKFFSPCPEFTVPFCYLFAFAHAVPFAWNLSLSLSLFLSFKTQLTRHRIGPSLIGLLQHSVSFPIIVMGTEADRSGEASCKLQRTVTAKHRLEFLLNESEFFQWRSLPLLVPHGLKGTGSSFFSWKHF